MNRRSAALLVLSASLVLGLLADHLLRADPWGLNVPAGAAAFAARLLKEDDHKALMRELHRRCVRDADWRSWTLSHWSASAILQAFPASSESSPNGGSPS